MKRILQPITDSRLIVAKGLLFFVLGVLAVAVIAAKSHDVQLVVLTLFAAWAFCRFYYFAFYVIEKYVDPSYRFDGLYAFLGYLWSRRRSLSKSTKVGYSQVETPTANQR